MQKGENGVSGGISIDLAGGMWYTEYVGAAEKPPVIFCKLTTSGCSVKRKQLRSP